MSSRLPIFHDNMNFQDRGDQMLRDMKLQMDNDFMRGFGRPFRSTLPHQPPSWFGPNDSLDRDFFHLRPTHTFPSSTFDSKVGMMPAMSSPGQMEVLDPKTVNNLFLEDPENKSRLFQMSFDVKDYDPKAIQVRVEDRCLVVEAKQSEIKEGGAKVAREFCRKIQLPPEIDPEKLSSTLSSDGILSVKAPVPPQYHHVQSGNGSSTFPHATMQQQQQQQQLHMPQQQFPSNNNTFVTTFKTSPPSYQQQQQQQQRVPFTSAPPNFPDFSPPPFPVITNTPLAQPQFISTPSSTLTSNSSNFTVPVLSADITTKDRPIFTVLADGSRKRMDLLLDLGRQYTADNIMVRFDDRSRRLTIEASKEERDSSGKVSRSQTQKQYDLAENIEPSSIQAIMKPDGLLHISALTSIY